MNKERGPEEFLTRPSVVFDLVGLTDSEREENSMFLGGQGAAFVEPGDEFRYGDVTDVVFRWGDKAAVGVFASLLEHIESPHPQLLDFSPTTVIGDQIYMLTLQYKGFKPSRVYPSRDSYFTLPFNEDKGIAALDEFLAKPIPRPELLGKVGSRWVRFGPGSNLYENIQEISEEHTAKLEDLGELTAKEVLDTATTIVDNWNFEKEPLEKTYEFATHITHWLMETFGQKSNDGDYSLWPKYGFGDGFEGAELPITLQHLIIHQLKDEMFVANDNNVKMQSSNEFVETDAFIPDWDKISELKTFQEMLDYIRRDPLIRDGIKDPVIGVIPQVGITFEPAHHHDWGIKFLVSRLGIKLAPFGKEGKTTAPTNFVIESLGKDKELARLVCDLALLAAKHTHQRSEIPAEELTLLQKRLIGEAPLPLIVGDHYPRAVSSMKMELIRRLREEE